MIGSTSRTPEAWLGVAQSTRPAQRQQLARLDYYHNKSGKTPRPTLLLLLVVVIVGSFVRLWPEDQVVESTAKEALRCAGPLGPPWGRC